MSRGGFDGFEDLIHGNAGIYGKDTASLSHALDDHDRREVTPTAEGLSLGFTHDACGGTQICVIEWCDILALSFGLPPRVAYSTRINPQEASLSERYPAWAQELGDWVLRDRTGPWVLRGMRCNYPSCPKREGMAIAVTPAEAIESIRVARAQRWIKDETPLTKWLQQAVALHVKSQQARQRP